MFRRNKKGKEDKKDKKGDKKGGSTSPPAPSSPPASPTTPHPAAAYSSPTGEESDDKRVSLPRRVKPAAKTTLPEPSPVPVRKLHAESGLQDLDDLIATIDQKLGPSRPESAAIPAASSPARSEAASPMPSMDAFSLVDSDDPLAALMSFAGGVPSSPSPSTATPSGPASPAPSPSRPPSAASPAQRVSITPAPAAASRPTSSFGSGRVSTSSVNETMLDDILKQFGGQSKPVPAPQRVSVAPSQQRHSEAVPDDPLAALLAMGGMGDDNVGGSTAAPSTLGNFPQRASIAPAGSLGGGGSFNAPPPAHHMMSAAGVTSFPQMGGFQQQPLQATYSGGAGPAIATGPGGYWGNTTVADDVYIAPGPGMHQPQHASFVEQHVPHPDDLAHFHQESVYIDSATQRYTLPQNKLELQLRHEMMSLRRNPRFYAQILMHEFRPFYQGTALRVPGQPGMATREGAVACDDAIRFLSSVMPMQAEIFLNFGMCLAAKEAVDECCPTGSFEYPDSVTKMMNYGYLEDEAKDLVGYGGKNVRHMILLAFIICDGDPMRERRGIIFDPRWKMMARRPCRKECRPFVPGVGAGEHNSPFKIMGVVNFAIAYTPLLDGMKQSPMFRNLVQVDLKDEAREARMLDALRSLQGGQAPVQAADDWRARLRDAALKVSQATGGMMLSDQREDTFIKAVDVFKQLKAVEDPSMEDETKAKLRQAALLVGKTTEHLVASNANDKQIVRPVDILKELQAVSTAPAQQDPLRAKLSSAALDAIQSTEEMIAQWGSPVQQHRGGGY